MSTGRPVSNLPESWFPGTRIFTAVPELGFGTQPINAIVSGTLE